MCLAIFVYTPFLYFVFSLLDELDNTCTFLKIEFIFCLLPGLLVWRVNAWPLDRMGLLWTSLLIISQSENSGKFTLSLTHPSIHLFNWYILNTYHLPVTVQGRKHNGQQRDKSPVFVEIPF